VVWDIKNFGRKIIVLERKHLAILRGVLILTKIEEYINIFFNYRRMILNLIKNKGRRKKWVI